MRPRPRPRGWRRNERHPQAVPRAQQLPRRLGREVGRGEPWCRRGSRERCRGRRRPIQARRASPAPRPAARDEAATKPSPAAGPGRAARRTPRRARGSSCRAAPAAPRDRLLRPLPPPEAAASALPRLAPREQQLHQHPLRQHDLPAPRVEAQRRDLDDGALRLALEDARQQPREIASKRAAATTPESARRPRAHRPVARHLHLRLAERGRDQALEAHLIERPHPAELGPPSDDRVHQRAPEGQRRGLRVLREVEAGDEDAHAARSSAPEV